jgi:ABC-2 type transport system permease protein
MSGLFTPIESMPNWAQQVTLFNPIRYFVEIIRMVMLKGATFSDISRPFFNLLCFYNKWICCFVIKKQLKILRTVFPVDAFISICLN